MSDVLGFDVSLNRTGWAILNFKDGSLVDSGIIEPDRDFNLYQKLKFIALSTEDIFSDVEFELANVALEGGFSGGSGKVTRVLAMAWAMVALTTYEVTGLEPAVYPPSQVKKLATGKGNAKKVEVTASAFSKWGIDDPDIGDACWIAEMCRREIVGVLSDDS